MINNKRPIHIAPPQPSPQDIADAMAAAGVKAQLGITTFADGRPPAIQCTSDPLGALEMLLVGLQTVAQALNPAPPTGTRAEPTFTKREYLGPRDGVKVYDKGEG